MLSAKKMTLIPAARPGCTPPGFVRRDFTDEGPAKGTEDGGTE